MAVFAAIVLFGGFISGERGPEAAPTLVAIAVGLGVTAIIAAVVVLNLRPSRTRPTSVLDTAVVLPLLVALLVGGTSMPCSRLETNRPNRRHRADRWRRQAPVKGRDGSAVPRLAGGCPLPMGAGQRFSATQYRAMKTATAVLAAATRTLAAGAANAIEPASFDSRQRT